jgi:tetratricopeptide (TPR) repeat protein
MRRKCNAGSRPLILGQPMRFARTAPWLLPALAALLLFLPVLGAGFVHDDVVLLRDNPNIRSLGGIAQGFTQPYWEIAADPRAHVGGFYRPLGVTAFVLLHAVGGGSPLPFHLASLLLHAAVSALVAVLALRLGWRPLAAGLAGALFALHGMHVEAVAWASSLTYLIAAVGVLGGAVALLDRRWFLAGLLFLAGMLGQEAAIGPWLLAVAYQALRGDLEGAGPRRRGLVALLASGAALYLLRFQAFDDPRAGFFGRPITELALPPAELWAISFSVQLEALRHLVAPWPHLPFRPLPSPERITLADPERWLPALLGALALLGAASWWLRDALRWRRGGCPSPLLLPLGLMFAALLPLLSVSNLGQFPFEERFLYLPSAGFALAAGWLLARWRAATWAAAPLLAVHAASAWVTVPHWADEESFTSWGMEASPNAMMPFNEHGRLRLEAAAQLPPGDPERVRLAELAEEDYTKGLQISVAEWVVTSIDRQQGNFGLATALFYQGAYDLAKDAYEQILERWPDSAQALHGLGTTLAEQGAALLAEGREEEGRRLLEQALEKQVGVCELAPGWDAALHARGLVLARLGRAAEAVDWLEQAFAANPADDGYRMDLAEASFAAGRPERTAELVEDFLAREADPQRRAEVLFQVGMMQLGRVEEFAAGDPAAAREAARAALGSLERADALAPDRVEVLLGLAGAHEMLGGPEAGLPFAERAFRRAPGHFPAAQTLFALQFAAGLQEPAEQTLEVWLRAAPEEDPARPFVAQTLREMREMRRLQEQRGQGEGG